MTLSLLANILMGSANVLFGTTVTLLIFGILHCVNGAAQSSGWSGVVKNMAPWFHRRERGIVMSWWATCYVVGGIVATAFATYLVTHPVLYRAEDLKRPQVTVAVLHEQRGPFAQYLRASLSVESQKQIDQYAGEEKIPKFLQQALADDFNTVIQGPWIYAEQRFAGVELSDGTRKRIENALIHRRDGGALPKSLQGDNLILFNKTLLREALPQQFKLGWRRAFIGPAIVLALVALLFSQLTRNKPQDVGLAPISPIAANQTERQAKEQSGEDADLSSRQILLHVLSNPVMWLIGLMYFCLKLGRYALLFWLPFYMVDHLGYGLAEAGYTSILYEAVGFIGVISAGYISDKLFRSRRMPVGALGMWLLALTCLFHPFLAATGHLGNAIGISLIGLFTYGPDSLMSGAAIIDAGSEKAAGFAAGFTNGVGSLGQILSPLVVVFISETYGWDQLFYFFVVIAFIGGSLLALKWNWIPKEHQD